MVVVVFWYSRFIDLEPGLGEPAADLDRPEAEPQISMRLTHGFVFVLGQIDDGEASPWRQGPPGFFDRRLRSGHVMQHHASDDSVDFTVSDGQVFEVAKAEVATINSRLACSLPRQLQHRRRRIDGDHLLRPLQQGRQHQT